MPYAYDDFTAVATKYTRNDPRLEYLERDELITLLPNTMQKEIRRAEWAFKNIDKLAGIEVLDPFTQAPVRDYIIPRDDIMLLFDPPFFEVPGMSEEDNLLAYIASDSVLWSRMNLKMNPRLYQILIMRNTGTRKILRLGRRCGKTATFAMRMLHRAMTQNGHKSLLVAPMKAHCEVVWQMLKEALRRDEDLGKLLMSRDIRQVEAPHYQMTFPNGSQITMFTSGIKSNSHGDSIRGQEADDLYLDEVDLMSVEDLPAFSAILRDTGRPFEKSMTIASTPNGRRDMMYRFSTDFRVESEENETPYIEYYFPTHADVNYTRANDFEQKTLITANQYQHEILAIYGEETSGVFLKAHIERALNHYNKGYSYIDTDVLLNPEQNTKLIIGVDWDKFGAGVNIVMSAANYNIKDRENPASGRIMPIARWEVPRGSDTLTRATEFVKTLYAWFKPDAIYIDRGYGDMQYENLTLAAESASAVGGDRRCIGLEKVLKGISLASAVTIYDPMTNEEIKKPIKDYMVSLTIKMFEDDQIILNARDFDEVPGTTDMIKQFEGYQIIRRTQTGIPVYEAASTAVGDHALDAFMFTVLAMHQEWGSFARPEQHAAPMSVPFNIMDIMSDKKLNLGQDHDPSEIPETFLVHRTNIRGGKMTYGGNGRGSRRLRRKGL